MSIREKTRHIIAEVRGHARFTLVGALLGIFFVLVFRNLGNVSGRSLFIIFHPAHVILSAMVTASMFKLHAARKNFFLVLVVGYFGSVGIATLSDIVIPHVGTALLGLNIPTHTKLHGQEGASANESTAGGGHDHNEHKRRIHLGFIEEWYLVNPAALLGVVIAFFLSRTKLPHAGHVLVSTWASSSYLLMNMRGELTVGAGAGIFATLFLAIWVPCSISDIVFPLLFVKSDLELAEACPDHGVHSHPHIHISSEAEA